MKTQEIQLLRLQQLRVLQLWLGPLALTLHFQHLLFLIGQLRIIIRIRSLNFGNTFLQSALMILSILTTFMSHVAKNFECLSERQHSFCLIWHCDLSVTGHRSAIDQMLEIKNLNY